MPIHSVPLPSQHLSLLCLYSANFSLLFLCESELCNAKTNHVKSTPLQVASLRRRNSSEQCHSISCPHNALANLFPATPEHDLSLPFLNGSSLNFAIPLHYVTSLVIAIALSGYALLFPYGTGPFHDFAMLYPSARCHSGTVRFFALPQQFHANPAQCFSPALRHHTELSHYSSFPSQRYSSPCLRYSNHRLYSRNKTKPLL